MNNIKALAIGKKRGEQDKELDLEGSLSYNSQNMDGSQSTLSSRNFLKDEPQLMFEESKVVREAKRKDSAPDYNSKITYSRAIKNEAKS